MENPDTLVLNLTFLGTMGVALLMFLVLFLLGVITLVLAGLGRLTAVVLMTLLGRAPGKRDSAGSAGAPARQPRPRTTFRERAAALKPGRLKESLRTAVVRHPKLAAARPEPQVLAEDWASAVAEADKRAQARARAAVPEIKLSVRDLPDPAVPADKVYEVAPLVESALHNHRPPHEMPRSFKKPQPLHPLPPLDTGSLVSLAGPQQVLKEQQAKENG
ncbi:hypothetical protein J2T22_002645 [Pseudarthrobacter defluvii]|uniref:Uncharacterized protein n=1 Tax=Pseudarthrobacter defluvii TaxID=410837 RepID=A0ABT9UIK2_9MICC|nr:hypothetical protein [Pseudarthrobacter defluvii]MDQ0119450.1 hypothetical protein [Pseudarthrobacter defluvii]